MKRSSIFNAEEFEARRYDDSLRHYENAAVKNRTSLSLLNIGQGVIIAAGLTAIMFMAGLGIKSGQLSVGDFAVVNVFLLQLYLPLNFFGFRLSGGASSPDRHGRHVCATQRAGGSAR